MKILLTLILLCLPFAHAHANPSDNPENDLNSTQEVLHEEVEKNHHLAAQIAEIQSELVDTKENLIETAALIRGNEDSLRDLEERMGRLQTSKEMMEKKLHDDRGAIARLIVTLERIRRLPPEAMLASPESPYKTAQSAMLMGQLIPSLERHTQALKNNLKTLENVTADLEKERANHIAISDSLKAQQTTLSTLLETRESIYKQTDMDFRSRQENIGKISLKAQNLEDLVEKLKDEETRERKRINAQKKKNSEAKEDELAALSDRLNAKQVLSKPQGQAQLPISGIIKVQYKGKDNLGADSNGLTIEGRESALVVAPLAGKIQFAGHFKKYGNIIIIEHDDGYHSLVAGLEKIDTLVGEYVETGEPVGVLPKTGPSGNPPSVYYELRHNGKPVNPSKKFSDLG